MNYKNQIFVSLFVMVTMFMNAQSGTTPVGFKAGAKGVNNTFVGEKVVKTQPLIKTHL